MTKLPTRIAMPRIALKLGTKAVMLAFALVAMTTAGVVFAAYQSLSAEFTGWLTPNRRWLAPAASRAARRICRRRKRRWQLFSAKV